MQTFEKIAHAPMPFTSGGQTITDRLNAAKHSLAGSQLGKTICKATTEELMAPKKKHLDYLLHCTNEPNVSIPSMANLLIERTQNPNWIVVYKALITIHNLMCYGNERFSQYLASCNTTFNLTNFVDKSSLQNGAIAAGYDMSTHVRRYGKYISEKIHTYRLCAFDFCKVKRGRDDGLLRTLHTDKLLKTMPILQAQIDALLEFQVNTSELNNGVINCSFILLFRDLIRLFACYNDGVINLLEKYFDMNKKQCREALDLYKAFLARLDKVSAFLSIAESVGIERGEVPDLTRAPASLLEALESHLYQLEGGRGPPPTSSAQQFVTQQIYSVQQEQNFQQYPTVDEVAKQRYLEEEKERLRQYEEERRRQLQQQEGPTSSNASMVPTINPFGPTMGSSKQNEAQQNSDLLFFDAPKSAGNQSQIDPTNPFAVVAEINNRSQPTQMHTPAPNPFMSGGVAPSQSAFVAQPAMPNHAVANPFMQQIPSATQPYGAGYGATPVPPAYFNNGPAGIAQPYWLQQTRTTPMTTPGIYSNTPFSGADGSYSTPSTLQQNMDQRGTAFSQQQPPQQQSQFTPQWPSANNGTNTQLQQRHGFDQNGLVGNMGILGNNQQEQPGQQPRQQWQMAQQQQQGQSSQQQNNPFGAPAYPQLSTNPF